MAFICGICCEDFFQSNEENRVAFGMPIPRLCRQLSKCMWSQDFGAATQDGSPCSHLPADGCHSPAQGRALLHVITVAGLCRMLCLWYDSPALGPASHPSESPGSWHRGRAPLGSEAAACTVCWCCELFLPSPRCCESEIRLTQFCGSRGCTLFETSWMVLFVCFFQRAGQDLNLSACPDFLEELNNALVQVACWTSGSVSGSSL